jgi:hypothetical protein
MRRYCGFALLSVMILAVGASAVEDPSYALSPWPFGAIAWVGGLPENVQTLSAALSQTTRSVFEGWGLSVPEPMDGWENPALVEPAWKSGKTGPVPQVVKKNPPTQELWRLNPLRWEGIEVYPLLYIAFPNRVLLAQAVGSTSTAAVWIPGSAAIAGSQVWFQALTGVPMSLAAPAWDGELTSCHELAHWMTYLVCLRNGIAMGNLPLFIVEGIAEYSTASEFGITGWKRSAAAWAQSNRLTVSLDPFATYLVGLSVVAYLVEEQGVDGFLASLGLWESNPHLMILQIEDRWREWLGVL